MKLKLKTLAALIAIGITAQSQAASNIYPVGSNLGYGDASNKNTIFQISANPAWVSSNLQNTNDYGVGITFGGTIQQKGADKVINDYKNNVDPILQKMNNNSSGTGQALTLAEDIKRVVNNLVLSTRDNFHIQATGAFSLPLQISHNSFGGIGLEISGLAQGREQLLSSNRPIDIDTNYLLTNLGATTQDIVDNGLIIQSAFYIKTALYNEAALTYGNLLYENELGVLSIGLRAKLMQAKLRKSIIDLGKLLKSGNSAGQQAFDDIRNTLGGGNFESAVGVDIGASWINPHWQVGLQVQNLNTPTLNYNVLGVGTSDQAYIEQFYASQISLQEKVKLKPQTKIEGAIYTENKHWVLAASYDFNESVDLLNNPYQWATISASYSSSASGDSWWYALIPDVRIGYRANMTGDNQRFITPGLSWGPLNLDIAFQSFNFNFGPDNIPEGFAFNLGLELQF